MTLGPFFLFFFHICSHFLPLSLPNAYLSEPLDNKNSLGSSGNFYSQQCCTFARHSSTILKEMSGYEVHQTMKEKIRKLHLNLYSPNFEFY